MYVDVDIVCKYIIYVKRIRVDVCVDMSILSVDIMCRYVDILVTSSVWESEDTMRENCSGY